MPSFVPDYTGLVPIAVTEEETATGRLLIVKRLAELRGMRPKCSLLTDAGQLPTWTNWFL
jgi:hypothetical protein